MNGTNLSITDSTGADAAADTKETDAVMETGATKAIFLAAGDSLVYDLNGNHKADKGEQVLVKMTEGTAMAFFTDLNTDATIGQTAQFDLNEFTGLALGDHVTATINGNVENIDTLLDANGAFTTVRQASDIKSLTITGTVFRNIQAGAEISGITFKVPKIDAFDYDVDEIRTGNLSENDLSFDGGTTILPLTFTQAPGTAGGSISNIVIPRYIDEIHAGDGGANTNGDGGKGGDLINIKVTGSVGDGFNAGQGGAVTNAGKGGIGGSLSKINLTLKFDGDATVNLRAGDGGDTASGAAGAGGAVSDVTIKNSAPISGIVIDGGSDGNVGLGSGQGGAGGSVMKATFIGTSGFPGGVSILGGHGGTGGDTGGGGGAGGAVTKASFSSPGQEGQMRIVGGDGGGVNSAALGGKGGDVTDAKIKITGYSNQSVAIIGGEGGSGGGAGGSVDKAKIDILDGDSDVFIEGGSGGSIDTGTANGGAAGNVSNSSITARMIIGSGVSIYGGEGGDAGGDDKVGGAGGGVTNSTIKTIGQLDDGGYTGIYGGDGGGGGAGDSAGGVGGSLSAVSVTSAGVDEDVEILSGNGGDGGGDGGDGGRGGDLTGGTVTNTDYVKGGVYLSSGDGGNSIVSTGNGAAGGNASNLKVTNKGGMAYLGIFSGDGGDSEATSGNGGNAGTLSKVVVTSMANIGSESEIGSGYGGNVDGTGNGGSSADATGITVTDKFGASATWFIYAGSGGRGNGAGGDGGNGGNLNNVTFNGTNSDVQFGYVHDDDNTGGTGAGSKGGNGGSLDGIKGSAATAAFLAQQGGGAAGTGGNGGSISNVNFKVSQFAHVISAGDGGSVAIGGNAGIGGSIDKVKITGSGVIGYFFEVFGLGGDDDSSMGGLTVGLGGAVNNIFDATRNGSITNVTATKIAAILAGAKVGNTVAAFNAVKSITGLKVSLIGADVDGDRQFDWEEDTATTTGFQLNGAAGVKDTDDVPKDGLIIVKTGGYTPDAKTKFLGGPGIPASGIIFV